MKPPSEVCDKGMMWKLKGSIYGLNDAPRTWYKRVEQVLVELGGKVSIYDEAICSCGTMMIVNSRGSWSLILMILCAVALHNGIMMKELIRTFRISTHTCGSSKYVGLNVRQTIDAVLVDHGDYIERLQPVSINAERTKQTDEKLTMEEGTKLRSLCGQLLWATTQTRPDATYNTCVVSNYGKEPAV